MEVQSSSSSFSSFLNAAPIIIVVSYITCKYLMHLSENKEIHYHAFDKKTKKPKRE